ncbi:unnamed protein product [Lampetra fluviatilis]
MASWMNILQGYPFTVRYTKGTHHVNVDALLHLPPPDSWRCVAGSSRCGPPLQTVPDMVTAAVSSPAGGVHAPNDRILGLDRVSTVGAAWNENLLLAPGTVVPVIEARTGELAAPEMVDPGAATPRQQPEDGWWKVSEQLDLLRAVVVQLVTLVTETTVAGHSALTSPGRNDQESGVDVLAGTSASAMAAIRRGEEDAQLDAAITVGPGEAQTEPAILRTKRDTQDPAPTARNEERGTERDPSQDGDPKGWSPQKVVVLPPDDATSEEDVTAALPV